MTNNILIINQHGENRGDEAAFKAMVSEISSKAKDDCAFRVIGQFRDKNYKLWENGSIEYANILMPVIDAICLPVYFGLRLIGLDTRFFLPGHSKQIVSWYDNADIVVSAPGGPYFGDIYKGHELVHWFFVFLARLFKKPLMLYSPSAGPFNFSPLNWIRRFGYRSFDVLCARESISAKNIETLCPGISVKVTADSALQCSDFSIDEDDLRIREITDYANAADRFVIISLLDYKFYNRTDSASLKSNYLESVRSLLEALDGQHSCYFLFLPQLAGEVHSDYDFIQRFTASLSLKGHTEILDRQFDSDVQRALVQLSDLVIASRYHPQIFAGSAIIPLLAIYYEHKSLGFMEMMGIKEYAISIWDITPGMATGVLKKLESSRDGIINTMRQNIEHIQEGSRISTSSVIELLEGNRE
ncbi:MAG: polysaccharide pyruvyl transferase family protein [Pseudomonadota bacterium]